MCGRPVGCFVNVVGAVIIAAAANVVAAGPIVVVPCYLRNLYVAVVALHSTAIVVAAAPLMH